VGGVCESWRPGRRPFSKRVEFEWRFSAEVKLIKLIGLVKIIQKCLAHYNQSLEIGIEKLVVKTAIELPA
jgi:hypothetical protein